MRRILLIVIIICICFIPYCKTLSNDIKYIILEDNSKLSCKDLMKDDLEDPELPSLGIINETNIQNKKIDEILLMVPERFKLRDITLIIQIINDKYWIKGIQYHYKIEKEKDLALIFCLDNDIIQLNDNNNIIYNSLDDRMRIKKKNKKAIKIFNDNLNYLKSLIPSDVYDFTILHNY